MLRLRSLRWLGYLLIGLGSGSAFAEDISAGTFAMLHPSAIFFAQKATLNQARILSVCCSLANPYGWRPGIDGPWREILCRDRAKGEHRAFSDRHPGADTRPGAHPGAIA